MLDPGIGRQRTPKKKKKKKKRHVIVNMTKWFGVFAMNSAYSIYKGIDF